MKPNPNRTCKSIFGSKAWRIPIQLRGLAPPRSKTCLFLPRETDWGVSGRLRPQFHPMRRARSAWFVRVLQLRPAPHPLGQIEMFVRWGSRLHSTNRQRRVWAHRAAGWEQDSWMGVLHTSAGCVAVPVVITPEELHTCVTPLRTTCTDLDVRAPAPHPCS